MPISYNNYYYFRAAYFRVKRNPADPLYERVINYNDIIRKCTYYAHIRDAHNAGYLL